MTDVNMRATLLTLQEEPGDTLHVDLTVVDATGDPVDLDAWTFTAPIAGTDVDLDPTVNSNVITLTLPAGTLAAGDYDWKLTGETGSTVLTWLAGKLQLKARPQKRGSAGTVTVTVQPADVTVTVAAAPDLVALTARVTALETDALTA